MWQALLAVTGDQVATEADYEHGYKREMRSDLLRYVTFDVQGEIYGLPIEQIVEISTAFPTTPVPRTSSFVIGIGNMRGSVMPVIDLARRLNLGSVNYSRETRVLIVRLGDDLDHGPVEKDAGGQDQDQAQARIARQRSSVAHEQAETDQRSDQHRQFRAASERQQDEDAELKTRFAKLARTLADNESKIIAELNDAQGSAVDIGGYYQPDPARAEKAMRPSPTFNAALDAA